MQFLTQMEVITHWGSHALEIPRTGDPRHWRSQHRANLVMASENSLRLKIRLEFSMLHVKKLERWRGLMP